MNWLTASDLSLFENLEARLQLDVSVSLLAELERELLRLRCELSSNEWAAFCAEFASRPIFSILRPDSAEIDVIEMVSASALPARPTMAASPTHVIQAWEYSLPVSRSVRAQKAYFAREIAETIRTGVKPRVLILGSSRLNEAEDAICSARLNHAEFLALETFADLEELGPKLGFFDLIYSTSWLDNSDDLEATAWLETAAEMLRAGGRILAVNLAAGSRDAGWVEACWGWQPFFRSEEYLAQLVMELKYPGIRGHAVFRDESGASVYLEIHSI